MLLSSSAIAAERSNHITSQLLVEQFGHPLGIADEQDVPPLTSLALDLVKDFEQWKPEAYDDAAGFCTIGYGHLIALHPCSQTQLGSFAAGLTQMQGSQLLDEDTLGARAAVHDLVTVPLSDNQFGALSSFVFNVGRRNFSQSTLLELLNSGDYDGAAAELPRWVKAGGQVLQGLVDRRSCEEWLFLGRLHYNQQGRFERASCEALGVATNSGALVDIETGERGR